MKLLPLLCFSSALFLAVPALSLPLKAYKAAQKSDNLETVENYLDGVGNGFFWANATLHADNKEPLFCSPDMALNQENYLTLLDREIKNGMSPKTAWRDDDAIEVILLRALQRTFPCKK